MAPYSMDLRQRVARAWDAGMDAETVAGKYDVSRAWVHRLIQRRRETGSLRSRKQQKFRHRVLSSREEERLASLITAHPDATLTELRAALPTTAALSTLWRTIDRLGFTLKKKRYTPTNIRESFRFENLADFATRQDAKLTQPAPQPGSRTLRLAIDVQFPRNQLTQRTTRALRSDSSGRIQPCRPGSRCPTPGKGPRKPRPRAR